MKVDDDDEVMEDPSNRQDEQSDSEEEQRKFKEAVDAAHEEMERRDFDTEEIDSGADDDEVFEIPDDPIIEDVEEKEENEMYEQMRIEEEEKIKKMSRWAHPLKVGSIRQCLTGNA